MDGYEKAKQIFEVLVTDFEKNRDSAMENFLEQKNKNDSALAHGYDMQVIAYEHTITCLQMALTTLKRSKNSNEFDGMVKAHEANMKFMIDNLTK